LIQLNFPSYTFDIREQGQKKMIFDMVRKKLIPLTPEEWVRQHAISFLNTHYRIPLSRIAVERELRFNKLRKRFDIVVFSTSATPICLVECKAPEIVLSSETILQIGMYNQTLACPNLWITNGLQHQWFLLELGKLQQAEFPHSL
jgi:Type I restriction enzyme R protein N terminus (HSDR_N)